MSRSIRRKETTPSILYDYSNLPQAVIDTFYACNFVTEAFGDDHTDSIGGPGTAAQNRKLKLKNTISLAIQKIVNREKLCPKEMKKLITAMDQNTATIAHEPRNRESRESNPCPAITEDGSPVNENIKKAGTSQPVRDQGSHLHR
ncbi:unnamed protein product [Heligmosomoides polygyrus]|uniref:BEN domain-containing protein n=1 Tax=Heligmosomoides polygyrus TaxID=6339 RepID=A0A183G1V9_HELPZ|nr:unnamed protein product [Heligmosomoides polygyrus]